MKSEMERVNNWVDWYEVKLNKIREAPVDRRLQMLERLYRINQKNKDCGVTITSTGVINPVSYPEYPPELKIPEYKDPNDPVRKEYNQVDYFKKVVKSYRGLDEDANKYVKKVKPLIDCNQLDNLELKHVRLPMAKV